MCQLHQSIIVKLPNFTMQYYNNTTRDWRDKMKEISKYDQFSTITPINKGWSTDKKFFVKTKNDEKWLLRTADIANYEQKKQEFNIIQQLSSHLIPMSRPIEFGICDEGQTVYSLLTWCEGEDAEQVLAQLDEAKQYELGLKAGQLLKTIHRYPAPLHVENWASRFNQKINTKLHHYHKCGIKIEGDSDMIAYIEAYRYLLEERPQCLQHGDYHVGNMVITPQGKELSIIDFNRHDYGDPWEEFNRIVWSAQVSPHFATGQLDGYFEGQPPLEFFKILALYISNNTLSSIYWAIPFGEDEIMVMINQAKAILSWYDNMNNVIPSWYNTELHIKYKNL